MQLYLIRHPRPALADGICYGQLDVDAENPLPLAARLRALLPPATAVVSSPLRRARALAEALQPQAEVDERLMEIAFGDWEGRRWSEIDRHLLDAWAADPLHFAPPGGESAAGLQMRVVSCLSGLAGFPGNRAAVVTHAGVIRAALGHWLQLPIAEWSQLPLAFGSVTLLEIDRPPAAPGQPPARARLHYRNR